MRNIKLVNFDFSFNILPELVHCLLSTRDAHGVFGLNHLVDPHFWEKSRVFNFSFLKPLIHQVFAMLNHLNRWKAIYKFFGMGSIVVEGASSNDAKALEMAAEDNG